jgi:hypothetical protein
MTLRARLSRLEATVPTEKHRPCHGVTGDSREECEEQRRAMIKAGKAAKSDFFIFRIILRPPFASLGANVQPAERPA